MKKSEKYVHNDKERKNKAYFKLSKKSFMRCDLHYTLQRFYNYKQIMVLYL